jgi:hypothetical protein
MGHLHCQHLLCLWLGNGCLSKFLTAPRPFDEIRLGPRFFPTLGFGHNRSVETPPRIISFPCSAPPQTGQRLHWGQ